MFEEIKNLLSEKDAAYLQNKCDNFVVNDKPFSDEIKNTKNYYVRNMVDIKNNLLEYQSEIENYLFLKFNIKYKINAIWINKVTSETNQSDDYHLDASDLTIITYLNDDFTGGEFVYLDENNKSILVKPKKETAILQSNKLSHKVNPVTNGIRYSCVTFLNYVVKDKKTLL
jgi:predicted 2-oxoglutarate/Fe(II)-dependent dioxygenase YbiX